MIFSRADDAPADEPPRRARVLAAGIASALLLLLHALQACAVALVLARASSGVTHVALVLAGSLAALVFYTWATRGIFARRASAARWSLRVDLLLAALGVVTLADEWSHFDRPWVDLTRLDPLAVTSLGFPAVMTLVYLVGAGLARAARADLDDA